jgi:hypothetical protein
VKSTRRGVGLISDEEWLKIKDLATARDDGAPDSALLPTTIAAAAADRPAFDQARYHVCKLSRHRRLQKGYR